MSYKGIQDSGYLRALAGCYPAFHPARGATTKPSVVLSRYGRLRSSDLSLMRGLLYRLSYTAILAGYLSPAAPPEPSGLQAGYGRLIDG